MVYFYNQLAFNDQIKLLTRLDYISSWILVMAFSNETFLFVFSLRTVVFFMLPRQRIKGVPFEVVLQSINFPDTYMYIRVSRGYIMLTLKSFCTTLFSNQPVVTIHCKTPAMLSNFNEMWLRQRCFPAIFAKCFLIDFSQNTYWRLFLMSFG